VKSKYGFEVINAKSAV
jgi:hypothetical protein